MTATTPITDTALFNHDPKTRVVSLEVVGALAECSRRLERDRAALIAALIETVRRCEASFPRNTPLFELDAARAVLSRVRS